MSVKNPEYDFKWCPGCGDFGVRRALQTALERRRVETELPMESNVVVAGIGCSGNLVHLMDGPQPYGFHGIHGRTLPIAMGVKLANPNLNVVIVAGDGDFLGIGVEHLPPQASRNLDVTAIIMDNAVYGLTKGQSSPTTELGGITSSTPFGKTEEPVDPLRLYLNLGVSFVASAISSRVKQLSQLIDDAMEHRGFSIVHVQSPCTTYNDTYEKLKGDRSQGIEPLAWDIPDEHDPSDLEAAFKLVASTGVPMGTVFRADRPTLDQRIAELSQRLRPRTVEQLIATHAL